MGDHINDEEMFNGSFIKVIKERFFYLHEDPKFAVHLFISQR